MKRILFTLILVMSALPGVAAGNTYCNTRSSIGEAQRCYTAVNEQSLKSVRNLYLKIDALPQAHKRAPNIRALLQDIDNALIDTVNGCNTMACEYEVLERTRKDLFQMYRQLGGQ